MDKLTMAHDWAMRMLAHDTRYSDAIDFTARAWQYADAMQAEADKRNKAEAEQKRKEIREMLNAPNTFIEREGNHFDDVEEWQPDWSQAPEWAVAWTMDSGETLWWSYKPVLNNGYWFIEDSVLWKCAEAPSFNYQGDWKESLRERPKPKCEVDWRAAPGWAAEWNMSGGSAHWLSKKGCKSALAPSFGFTGTHIVERPNGF